jgi:TRAP-type mannitol/chloroaromatic compound transport system permease small subunit
VRLLDLFDTIGEWIGRTVALAIFLMIGIVCYEIIARYFFNAPTRWVHDASGWLQVAYVFLGGAFALQRGYFVRVDLFYARMSARTQAWVDVTLSTTLFALFATVMIWKGLGLAMSSYNMGEISSTGTWQGPVWPAKFMVPIGVALLSLAWISRVGRQLVLLAERDTAA